MYPKVSIIIPVYNAGAFLKKTLEKILKQTYKNIEIIIVDDASTDGSVDIAESFNNDKIKIICQANSGAGVARNTGLTVASGKYIQFLDADDYLSEDKIEKQVQALEMQPDKVAVCNYVQFTDKEGFLNKNISYQDGFIFSSDKPDEFLINLYGGYGEPNFIQTNCWLVPKSVIDKSGGWRNYRCPDDDGEFFARVLLQSKGVVYVPGACNYYRIDNNNKSLSRNSANKYLHNVLLTIDLKYSYLKKVSSNPAINNFLARHYLEFAIYNYPRNKVLSGIAFRRYKKLNVRSKVPLLGGRVIHIISSLFGWRLARLIKYYSNGS